MPIINRIKGNLLDSKDYVIAHGVNCKGVMGAGVALEISNKFPEVLNEYKITCKQYDAKELLGSVETFKVDNGQYIMNIFTQDKTGTASRKLNYGALAKGFGIVDKILQKQCAESSNADMLSLSIPKIGSGLAGGDWEIIEEIINYTTPNLNITVYEL